jgi:hypothetical protein
MAMTNSRTTPLESTRNLSCHGSSQGLSDRVSWRHILVVVEAAAAITGTLALHQHWLVLADVVPFLYVLPCLAMMLMCNRRMNRGKESGTARASAHANERTEQAT